jgi:hypothetical protein
MLLESEEISQEIPIPQRHDMHIIGSISPRTLKSKNLMNQDNFRVDFSQVLEVSFVERVTCGVPQVSVLGPLLFVSYINDVSRVIKYSRFHIYADELQIYHSSSLSDLQRCYDEIIQYGLAADT